MKERIIFTAVVCAIFAAVIVLIMHIERAGSAEKESAEPADAEQEADEVPPDEPEASYEMLYIIIRNMNIPIDSTHLNLTDMNLTCEDIVPLQYLTNLTELNLWGSNRVIDLSPLANLTQLKVLQIGGNPVSDISPLANLVNLEELRASGCNISDLTPLTNLTKMRHLTLRENNISDISPLANMTELTTLRLNDNPITDWSPVAHVHEVDGRP
jgi:hypothetical protein